MQHATFRQLQVFEAVARNRSFTRAAVELGLSQPTVSMQIKKLADEVGTPLFEPLGKGVRLTEVGRALQTACREIFGALERFEMAISDLQGLRTGSLHLAVVNTGKYFIPLILGAFCKQHPGIEVALEVTGRDEVLSRLASDLDDLYIMDEPPEHNSVRCIPFLDNALVMVAPPDHPLVGEHSIALEVLSHEPLLTRESASGTRHAMERFFAGRGLQPNIRMVLGNNEAIKQAVVGGLGIAVLSRHALAGELASGRLVELDIQGFPLPGQWYTVIPESKTLSVVAQSFLDFLREEGPTIVARDH